MISIFVFGLTADVWAKKFDLKNLGGDLLKTAAGGAIIRQIAGPLNDFLNSLMLAHYAENRDFTKVVPIFTIGNQAAIGAAQAGLIPSCRGSGLSRPTCARGNPDTS